MENRTLRSNLELECSIGDSERINRDCQVDQSRSTGREGNLLEQEAVMKRLLEQTAGE